MVLGNGAFGGWLGLEDGALLNGFSALINKPWETSLLLPLWGHTKRALYESGREPSPENESAGNSSLDFPISRTGTKKFLRL